MSSPRSIHAGGFTFLEAVIALTMLAGISMAILHMNAQSLRAQRDVRMRLAQHLTTESILARYDSGALGRPTIDPDSGTATWRGRAGDQSFVLSRRIIEIPGGATEAIGSPLPFNAAELRLQVGEKRVTLIRPR